MSKIKKYNYVDGENGAVYVGYTADIKAMYKSLVRASNKYNTNLKPVFLEMPTFSKYAEVYGIQVLADDFLIMSGKNVLLMIIDGELEEVKYVIHKKPANADH